MLVSRSNLNVQSSCALACPPPKTIFRAGGGSRAEVECFHKFPPMFMETVHCIARTTAPSSASGTFSPPLKSAVGRRTLDEHCLTDSGLDPRQGRAQSKNVA